MSFVSAMISIISFILVSLGIGSSSFSNCLSCTVRLFIWYRPCFLRKYCIVINTPFRTVFATYWGFPCGKSTCNAGYLGSIPGLGRPTGKGKGYPLQHFGLENSMACVVHGVTKSLTWLSDFHVTSYFTLPHTKGYGSLCFHFQLFPFYF